MLKQNFIQKIGNYFGCNLIRYFFNYNFKKAYLISKYICWQGSPSQTVNLINENNPIQFYIKDSKNNFIKVLAISTSEINFKFLENFSNNSSVQHNNHTLYAGKNKQNVILKKILFSDIESGNYSLKKFSSYDVIWVIEKDYLLLKKILDNSFENLPMNIPKLAIVTQNGESESNIQFFKKFCLYKIINLKKLQINEYQEHLINNCYMLLSNPKQGLTEEFYFRNKPSQIGISMPFLMITAVAVVTIVMGVKYKKQLKQFLKI